VRSSGRVLSAPEIADVFLVSSEELLSGKEAKETEAEMLSRVEQEAYDRGVKDGQVKAEQEAMDRIDEQCRLLSSAVEQLDRDREELLRSMEVESAKLAMAIASKLVFRECKTSKDVVCRIAKEATKQVMLKSVVSIRVNPQDEEQIRDSYVANLGNEGKHIKVTGDPEITRGGCIVETDLGSIDATIVSQWRQIAERMLCDEDG